VARWQEKNRDRYRAYRRDLMRRIRAAEKASQAQPGALADNHVGRPRNKLGRETRNNREIATGELSVQIERLALAPAELVETLF
jgi:hypothetical protein